MALPLQNSPRDIKLGPDNDLVLAGGDLLLTYGVEAVAQSCRIALQVFREEWFFDLDAGMPYWQEILGAKPAEGIEAARRAALSTLVQVDGVINVTRLDVEYVPATRGLIIIWQVATAAGETPVDVIRVAILGEEA